MSNNIANINATKHVLPNKFGVNDLGVANLKLEIKIHKINHDLALSQPYYIWKVFEKFKYLNFKTAKKNDYVNLNLAKTKGESKYHINYAKVLENLMLWIVHDHT